MIIPPSPAPWLLAAGTSSSDLVPASAASPSAFKNRFTLELRRAPLHLTSKWKRKRRKRPKRERKLALIGKTKLTRLASNWMQRAKKTRDLCAGLTRVVIKQRRPGASSKTKGTWKGAGAMKRFLDASICSRNAASFSSTKRDESKLSFSQTFNPTDADSSPSTYASLNKEACSDFSFDYVRKPQIGKWGYWNCPDYMNSDSTHEKQSGNVDGKLISEKSVMSSEKVRGLPKMKSWACIQAKFSKVGKKRPQKIGATCKHDVVNSIKRVEKYREQATDSTKTKGKQAASCSERRKCYKLTLFGGRKLSMGRKGSLNKKLTTAPDLKALILQEKASDLPPVHNGKKNTNQEKLMSKCKAATGTKSSQVLKRLTIPVVSILSKQYLGVKGGYNEAASNSKLWRRTILPPVQMLSSKTIQKPSSELNELYSEESVESTRRATGTVTAVNANSKLLENMYSKSSGNDHPFTDISSRLPLNAMQSSLQASKGHKKRSAVTLEAGTSGHTADLVASLDAKMDMRANHILTPIHVDNQVEGGAHTQPQTSLMVDDDEESVHSRLISSSSSDLGTIEMELSPFENCVSILQLPNAPIVKEFKEAVDDAHFKTRVLAGLLTVEKGAKMASVRDFQSKRMILSMGMMGAQMLEGELSLEKPWHFKYVLDYCVSSIFFNGPHSSSHCICSRRSSFSIYHKSAIYDSFCNDINFASVTFDSFCDEATLAVEELVGSKAKAWSDALTNMFWNCAVCCFQVHKLIVAIRKYKRTMQILHPHRGAVFNASAMDPLDTGNFNAFHKKVLFTIFSGFMLEGKVLYKSQVYLEPKVAVITL